MDEEPRKSESPQMLDLTAIELDQMLGVFISLLSSKAWQYMGLRLTPGKGEIEKDLVKAAVSKVALLEPAVETEVPIKRAALVIGGGVSGIQAALDLADTGYKVYLVEKEPSIGGRMAQIDKTFPTMDCSSCILTPKMSEVNRNKNIELLTYSEVVEVTGYVGNFEATI